MCMCGIAGIMNYNENPNASQLVYMRELATELAVQSQKRGSDAVGIATFDRDGDFKILKKDLPADELTKFTTWNDFMKLNINSLTTHILIHTRLSTKGSPTNNNNNHPIETATAVGIHNGWVSNDDDLFEDESLFRQAQVDSEVIFRLVDKQGGGTIDDIKAVAEKVEGVFAVSYVRKEEPTILNYFRTSNPTTFALIPELNIIVFASEKPFIDKAIELINKENELTNGLVLDTEQILFLSPSDCTMMQFNVDSDIYADFYQSEVEFQESFSSFYGGYYGSYRSWSDESTYYPSTSSNASKTRRETIYDFVEDTLETRLSEDEYQTLINLISEVENTGWASGWKAGRESVENDMLVMKELLERKHEQEVMDLLEEQMYENLPDIPEAK